MVGVGNVGSVVGAYAIRSSIGTRLPHNLIYPTSLTRLVWVPTGIIASLSIRPVFQPASYFGAIYAAPLSARGLSINLAISSIPDRPISLGMVRTPALGLIYITVGSDGVPGKTDISNGSNFVPPLGKRVKWGDISGAIDKPPPS